MYPDVLLAEMLLINQATESWFLPCLVKQTNKYKNCLFTQMKDDCFAKRHKNALSIVLLTVYFSCSSACNICLKFPLCAMCDPPDIVIRLFGDARNEIGKFCTAATELCHTPNMLVHCP